MAYLYTIDERSGGSGLSYSAGWLDAPYSLATPYQLVEGITAYGASIPEFYVPDKDTYSLGVLSPGSYEISARGHNWDWSNTIYGFSIPAIEIHNSYWQTVGSGAFGNYTLDVSQSDTYYVTVVGSSFGSNEYSVDYRALINSQPYGTASVSGSLEVGETVSAQYSIVDDNGITPGAIFIVWSESEDLTSWSVIEGETGTDLPLSASQVGKHVAYSLLYWDNDGFPNEFYSTTSQKIVADSAGPQLLFSTLDDVIVNPTTPHFLQFDENITLNAGVFHIKNASSEVVAQVSTTDTNHVAVVEDYVFLSLGDLLESGQAYSIEFSGALFSDFYGNEASGSIEKFIATTKPPAYTTPAEIASPLVDDQLVNALTTGYSWAFDGEKTIDWSLSSGFDGEFWTDRPSTIENIDTALGFISHYIDVEFNYVGHFQDPEIAYDYGSDINFSFSKVGEQFDSQNIWAMGFFPTTSYDIGRYEGASGDIFFNLNSEANFLPSYAPGSSGWALILHEVGHALGLKHPFDSGGTGRPTFTELGISLFDIDVASVMSYSDDAAWNQLAWDPATPMPMDVYGLQALYGENPTSTAGDTIYTLGDEMEAYATVWDSGGEDSINLANISGGWRLVLPQALDLAGTELSLGFANPNDESDLSIPHNLFWLMGEFETVNGSSGADRFSGNELDNFFNGAAGNDIFYGSPGNDSIFGGEGTDAVIFGLSAQEFTVLTTSVLGTYTLELPDGSIQTLTSVERLQFSDGVSREIASFINEMPVASAVSVIAIEDIAKSGMLNGADADGDSITFSLVGDPSNGTVAVDAATGAYTYTPSQNYHGSDSFTFTVNDGKADSLEATVFVTVSAVNDMPLASNVSVTTNEDTAKVGTLVATDVDNEVLAFSKLSDPSHGSVTIDADTGEYTYKPAGNYSGSDSFKYKVSDGTVDSEAATVFITVSPALVLLNGSSGSDEISGNNAGNYVSGGGGDDVLRGFEDSNFLVYGAQDRLYDQAYVAATYDLDTDLGQLEFKRDSSDILVGGTGGDTLYGGAGSDLLVDLDAADMWGSDKTGFDGSGGDASLRDSKNNNVAENDIFVVRGGGSDTATIHNFHLSKYGTGLAGRSTSANDAIVFSIDTSTLGASFAAYEQSLLDAGGTPEEASLALYDYVYSRLEFERNLDGNGDEVLVTFNDGINSTPVGGTTIAGMSAALGDKNQLEVVELKWMARDLRDNLDGFNEKIDLQAASQSDGYELLPGLNIAVALELQQAGTVRGSNDYGVMAANLSEIDLAERIYNPGKADDHVFGTVGADSYEFIVQAFNESATTPATYDAGDDTVFDIGGEDVLSFSDATINDLHFSAVRVGRESSNNSLQVTYEQKAEMHDGEEVNNSGTITWQGHFREGGRQAAEVVEVAGLSGGRERYLLAQAYYDYDAKGYIKGAAKITANSAFDAIMVGQHKDNGESDKFVFEVAEGAPERKEQAAHFSNFDAGDIIDLSAYSAFGEGKVSHISVDEGGKVSTANVTFGDDSFVLDLIFHDAAFDPSALQGALIIDSVTTNQVAIVGVPGSESDPLNIT